MNAIAFLVVVVVTVKSEDTVFRIRKCCAENELILELSGACSENKLLKQKDHIYAVNDTDGTGTRRDASWPWWFPKDSEILSKSTNATLREFPNEYQLHAGERQPCSTSQAAFLPAYSYRYTFYDDGSLLLHANEDGLKRDMLFDPLSFCVDRLEMDTEPLSSEEDDVEGYAEAVLEFSDMEDFIVILCPCAKATCILKCCQPGMLYDMRQDNSDLCFRNRGADWSPVYAKDHNDSPDYFLLYNMPDCKPDESLVLPNYPKNVNDSGYVIYSNGSARVHGETYLNEPLQFCGENIIDGKDSHIYNRIVRCFPKYGVKSRWSEVRRILYGWICVIGAVFLLLTIVLHSSVPSLRKFNDRSLIYHTWSLLIGYVAVAVSQLGESSVSRGGCIVLGLLIQYCFLSAFFWLNVLCIDISYTFSSLRITRGIHTEYTRKKQIMYFAYGWLGPGIIVLVTALMEYHPAIPNHLVKPDIRDRCWFRSGSLAQILYFYGPIATLLAVNLFLFVYTSIKILRARRDINTTLGNRNENRRFLLYLKLFILMGLSWITELISSAVGGPEYYWFIPDTVNLLRAVFIFFIMCCKRHVWDEVKKRCRWNRERNVRRPSNTRSSSVLASSQMCDSFKQTNADSSL